VGQKSNQRRSGRISKEIAIILSGSDIEGLQFSETTKTLVLSRHGGSVLSRHKLVPEQEIFLRAVGAYREADVRVCGEIGECEEGHIYGVAFVDPLVDFWGIYFPPPDESGKDLVSVTLECTVCGRHAAVQFDATEMDVYIANDGGPRFCKRCLTSTFWKITTEAAAPEPEAPMPVAQKPEAQRDAQEEPNVRASPVAEAPTKPPRDRRKERRTNVNLTACIRSSGATKEALEQLLSEMKKRHGAAQGTEPTAEDWKELVESYKKYFREYDEIVACVDISFAGFCFHSSRQYSEKEMIEVAVPYTAGAVPKFVLARIKNVRKLQEGNVYRYGAAYIRSIRK
jgi:hypothetical protein